MFCYSDNPLIRSDNVRSVIINHSINSKLELFERFRVSLDIPYTTMTNFDAFRDVMEELEWVPEDEIRIYHNTLPDLDEKVLACYIDCLNIIDVEWEKYEERAGIIRKYMKNNGQAILEGAWINNKPKKFNVLFKKEDEDRVKFILKHYSKNYRECIHYDERGVEHIEDGKGSRGFFGVLRDYMKLLWKRILAYMI